MYSTNLFFDRIITKTFIAQVEHYPSLPSTNDWAKQQALEKQGELPLLVIADQQTAGRGRGKNVWWSATGSLTFSLLLPPTTWAKGDDRSPLVALAAAVAVVDTVAPLLPGRKVGIHWPNDVYVDAGKLSGILVEVLPDRHCVVGIGLNTNNSLAKAPPELQHKAASLIDLTGRRHDQTEILIVLLKNLERQFQQLTIDPKEIGLRADRLCLQRGETLTLQLGQQLYTGCCAGIDADGALLLEMPEGEKSFYSGVIIAL
jgi:BirA family transcriptional regulator, biotin operon repressor / biotin---[acetyl-CoA-carboxylase] ligase